jgi:hypothetical protein
VEELTDQLARSRERVHWSSRRRLVVLRHWPGDSVWVGRGEGPRRNPTNCRETRVWED